MFKNLTQHRTKFLDVILPIIFSKIPQKNVLLLRENADVTE